VPERFDRYFEPFVGGGAFFFELRPQRAFLSDSNAELITCYQAVRETPEELIEELEKHKYEKDYYYSIRNADRDSDFSSWGEIQRSGRLIYLNKTCFNGLYRVNGKGHFSVPFGRYSNPKIVDASTIRACSQVLQRAEIRCSSFLDIEEKVQSGDFVYFDPPYVPLSGTANFTGYTKGGFDHSLQEKLAALCKKIDARGASFLLSNSHTPSTLELYQGFNVSEVMVARAINSKADRRGEVKEILVSNY